ncbi:gliding motility protein GldN, partial [Flavobacteriaceae bacterium]|nr:gliding motility protein GldN [Flavobacteriaceae bacterium]
MPTGEYILEDGRTIVVLEEGIIDDVIEFADETQNDETKVEENIAKPLFWIFYPQIRKDLAKAYVFSERNSAVRKSFDELINSRRFDAVIYREENVYEDITLEDKYPKSSFMRLIESERIKEKIRNLE